MTNHLLSVIVFAPLVGALVNWLIGRRVRSEAFIGTVACASVGVSCVIAFLIAFTAGNGAALTNDAATPVMSHLWTWLQVGNFRADFGFAMDRLSGIYVCFITFVGLLIHIFATGYMHDDKGFYRFFTYLNLFMFMMLTLVLADNLLLMFVGWEGVGLCSYLLIGYYTDRKEAGDAAKKAFIANRIGDWGVILGIMLVFFLTQQAGHPSISFFDKTDMPSALKIIAAMPVDSFTWGAIIAGGITSAAVLLFIGATGKSAQIPLFVWLPDAMAGPTPVSALIHAATMVTAGVYMVVRCSAIYSHAPTATFIIAFIGAATALFAATIGIAQNDIKKVLAYSTVSQLGYMFLACGVGAYVAAIFHVMTHAFFKALLFLGSGSVIHGMHHEQDMRRMGGLRKYMPITFATMLTGWLAISGIPIFAGFFSKDEILWRTWSTDALGVSYVPQILWGVGALTALLTAVYMTRLMMMTFWGKERFLETNAGGQADEAHAAAYDKSDATHDAHSDSAGDRSHHEAGDHVSTRNEGFVSKSGAHNLTLADSTHDDMHAHDMDKDDDEAHAHHGAGPHIPHESPWVMTVPLIVLAVLSTFGGLLGVPYALSGGAIHNYFERTLEPVVIHATEESPAGHTASARIADGETNAQTRGVEMLSPTPQPHDGASPLSVGEGSIGEPARERVPDSHEVSMERLFTGISILIAAVGIGIGVFVFYRKPLTVMPSLLENKYYVDEVYDAVIINPIKVGSREGLWKIFDVGVVDGIVNGVGRGLREMGFVARFIQPGYVRGYAAIILLGALALIGFFAYSAFLVR